MMKVLVLDIKGGIQDLILVTARMNVKEKNRGYEKGRRVVSFNR